MFENKVLRLYEPKREEGAYKTRKSVTCILFFCR